MTKKGVIGSKQTLSSIAKDEGMQFFDGSELDRQLARAKVDVKRLSSTSE